MPERLRWAVNVQVEDGPGLAVSDLLEVAAYDKLDVEAPAAAGGSDGELTVQVQPSGGAHVHFLMMTASTYDPPLTFAIDGGADRQLDAPLVLIGAGAVALLGADPTQFVISNADTSPRAVEILVGRQMATP